MTSEPSPLVDDPRKTEVGFQFLLRHLFYSITCACMYFALVTYIGEFLATLVVGAFATPVLVFLMRIENMLLGALAGAVVAGIILGLVQTAFPPASPWFLFVSWLVYPPLGYVLALLYTADRTLRSL